MCVLGGLHTKCMSRRESTLRAAKELMLSSRAAAETDSKTEADATVRGDRVRRQTGLEDGSRCNSEGRQSEATDWAGRWRPGQERKRERERERERDAVG